MNSVSDRLKVVHELVAARKYAHAIELAGQLILEVGEHPEILRARSGAFACIGQLDDALRDAERSLWLQPDNLDYAIHNASLAIESGRPQDAVRLLESRVYSSRDGKLERVLSGALAACGEYKRALNYAELAFKNQPDNKDFIVHLEHVRKNAEQQLHIKKSTKTAKAPPRRPPTGVLEMRLRILHALVLREVAGQYEKSKIGYLWAIIEPIIHLMVLGFFFSLLNHSTAPLGQNLYLFYLTGLLPFFMVIHTGSKVMQGLTANRSLLLLPAIKIFDILCARGVLSFLTELLVALIILLLFNFVGIEAIPTDPLMTLGAILLIWFFGFSLGIFMAMLNELFDSWEMIWSQITRILYFCSGIFYVAEKMPPEIRVYLIWNPVLQCIEMLRMAFYSGFRPPWVSPEYLGMISLIFLGFGLLLMRLLDRRIEVES